MSGDNKQVQSESQNMDENAEQVTTESSAASLKETSGKVSPKHKV